MARTKLKNRERYPSGKAKPDASTPVAMIHRFLDRAKKECKQIHGPLGRLMLMGEFTAIDIAAADHYCRVRALYDVAKGCPPRNAQSPTYGAYVKGSSADMQPEQVSRAVAKYEALEEAIGRPGCLLLDRVAVCLEEPSWNERLILISLLHRLAVLAGLTNQNSAVKVPK